MFIEWIKDIWREKFFIIYICFLSVLLVYAVNNFAMKKKYVYSVSFYITNSELAKIIIDTDTLDSDIMMAESSKILLNSDYTTDTAGEMLIEKYGTEYLKNFFTITEDKDGNISISSDELKECIDVSIVSEGIAVLNIEVTTPSLYLTQDLGSFMTFLTPNIIFSVVSADYATPFDNARIRTESGFLGRKEILAAGLAFGFILSIIIIALYKKGFIKNIIMSKEDIDSCSSAEIHTLGNIPYYEFNVKGDLNGKGRVK